MAKKINFAAAKAQQAIQHRDASLPALDDHTARVERATPGRKPDFPGEELARVNAFVPKQLAWQIKEAAFKKGVSISQLVAEWAKTLK